MPKGYIIGHVTIHDTDEYAKYGARNNELMPAAGGKFLVRGGKSEYLEGEGHTRHVVIEFPSYEEALAFYNSPEYQENMKIRQANSDGNIVVVEGYE